MGFAFATNDVNNLISAILKDEPGLS